MRPGPGLRLAAALVAAAAALPGADLVLRPAATVAAATVRLGDIADAVPDALAAIPVLATPGHGRWTVDARRVRAADPRLAGFEVRGACAVVRPPETVPADSIARAALDRIAAEAGGDRLQPTLLGLPAAALAPAGAGIRLEAEPLGPVNGRTALRVRILADGQEVDRRLVQAEVRRVREVLVAARALPRDAVIAPGDLRREWVAVPPGRDDLVADPALAAGRLLTAPLAAGAPIAARLLREVPAVRTGQGVRLVVRVGSAEAVGAATALADGAVGERITVRRAADAATLLATVRGPGEVELVR